MLHMVIIASYRAYSGSAFLSLSNQACFSQASQDWRNLYDHEQ